MRSLNIELWRARSDLDTVRRFLEADLAIQKIRRGGIDGPWNLESPMLDAINNARALFAELAAAMEMAAAPKVPYIEKPKASIPVPEVTPPVAS